MAFGFFKKKISADIIYMNGHIYTQDPEYPWATAVACKDNEIMAVGDFEAMDDIVSEETEVVDLNERYLFPGFIDVHSAPVLQAFEGSYFKINRDWDVEPILDILTDYAEDCEEDSIFGYGFHERILERYDSAEAAHAALDEIDRRRPILLLGESGHHCWMNSVAASIVRTVAEDEDIDYITTNFILNVLSPLPLEELEKAWIKHSEELSDKGFTSIFNLCAPDCFTDIYLSNIMSAIGEGEEDIMQRFHGSVFVNRPFQPQLILHRLASARTSCVELDSLVTADFAKLDVCEDTGNAGFSQESLNSICLNLAEHGYGIHLDARDSSSFEMAEKAFSLLREKGYRNIPLILASRYDASSDFEDAYLSTWPTDIWENRFFEYVDSVEAAINALTIDAAELLGKSKILGSIEKGKLADFAVFSENPLNSSLERFASMHADMTILDGHIVYDADEAAADEMCDLLFSMHL
ncbi:MAG: amidohydrolase family protein [Firmicutes bacterium]|nr:amidohydrolase family protein [Bacillota bacterium]